MQQCKPIQCASVANPSEVRRYLFCRNYDTCLDHAIKSCWDGFSCEECQCYERVQWDADEWAEDHSRCLTLAYFVAFAKMKNQLRVAKSSVTDDFMFSFSGKETAISHELS